MTRALIDAPVFPWHREEAVRFHRMLCNSFANPVIIGLFCKKSVENMPPLDITGAADEVWARALEICVRLGALRTLCHRLRPELGNVEALAALEGFVNAPATTNLTVLPGPPGQPGAVMLDRAKLRKHISQLAPVTTPLKVLLVRGEPRSGKSHSRHLFELAAREAGAKPVYLCDGIVATVDDVLANLFGAYGAGAEIPAPDSTEHSWYKTTCVRLLEVAERKKRALWIAVDDLGSDEDGVPLLDTAIRAFFDQFAVYLLSGVYKDWFRLMLIGYPNGPVPTKWKHGLWDEDRTAVADVTVNHVIAHLHSWWTYRNRSVLPGQAEHHAAELMAQIGRVDDLARLPTLNELLSKTLEDPAPQ